MICLRKSSELILLSSITNATTTDDTPSIFLVTVILICLFGCIFPRIVLNSSVLVLYRFEKPVASFDGKLTISANLTVLLSIFTIHNTYSYVTTHELFGDMEVYSEQPPPKAFLGTLAKLHKALSYQDQKSATSPP